MKSGIDEVTCNQSSNAPFEEILSQRLSRRDVVKGGLGGAALALLGGWASSLMAPRAEADTSLFGFTGVPVSTLDSVTVPPGYVVDVLYAWGDPISDGPVFKPDASNSAAEQEQQAGMHHDGLHFFPLPLGSGSSSHGLLAVNHEYTDDGLLHVGGVQPWTPEKVAKAQAAVGVSVVEVALSDGAWRVVRPSRSAQRVTGRTPIRLAGPAAGQAMMKTAADPAGFTVLGTMNNCAHGATPWGTYLTCEENFNGYFVNRSASIPPWQRRYGINERGAGYRWHEHDPRFDAAAHPNEPNRFGWVVEIDPYDPSRQPVKQTALGRFKHEGAAVTLAPDNRVVVYMGDDERFEYIYKFVSRKTYAPADREANMRLLEEGTLYVASATKMDRPEWVAVHPRSRDVYCTLTNNASRGVQGRPGTDPMNPRSDNVFGHIIRWRETGGNPMATAFEWDIFVLCGDPANPHEAKRGNIKGDIFGSPDGLWFDDRSVLWIQTDVSTSMLHKGDHANMGNNQMLAADPATGEVRRFLTGPKACEVTGVIMTPDGKTMFVNIQHPGETASERSDPAKPTAVSSWPDGPAGGRPRSASIVIRKRDGGAIGT